MKMIICDDQTIVRDGLEMLLKLEKDIKIVGVASDGAQAVEMTLQEKPDIVLMDLKMPIMNGVEAIRQIRLRCPEVKILVLTTYADDEWVADALRSGAAGYLLKDTPREAVLSAIRGTLEGKTFIDPLVAGKLLNQYKHQVKQPASSVISNLTTREREVLGLLAKGLSNEDIAKRLFLSEGTVRNYISFILAKLNVTDRTQAAILAVQNGIGPD
jgi:DNA-binding NarL/FixJ family response regulator